MIATCNVAYEENMAAVLTFLCCRQIDWEKRSTKEEKKAKLTFDLFNFDEP